MNFSLLHIISALLYFTVTRASELAHYEEAEMTPIEPSEFEMSWLEYFLIGLFSPEALNIVEKNILYEPKIVIISISDSDFGSNGVYYRLINEISINNFDDEVDASEEYHSPIYNDKLILKFSYDTRSFYQLTFDLYYELFSAAIVEINCQRLKELLAHGLGYKLSRDHVFELFSSAINAMIENLQIEETFKIIELLLSNNFVNIIDRNPSEDPSATWDSLFMNIFQNPAATQVFLNHDPEFFSSKTNFNYVALEITRFDFKAALNALNCGVDPSVLYNGRNALDALLAGIELGIESGMYINVAARERLRKQLNLKYPNLRESLTFDNFALACNEKRTNLAELILKSGKIIPATFYQPGNMITSPLSKAIHSEDLDLINLTCDLYLSSLTLDQVRHAKNEILSLIDDSGASGLESIYDILMKIEAKLKLSLSE